MNETPTIKRPPPHRNIIRAANLHGLRDQSLYGWMIKLCLLLLVGTLGAFGWAFYQRTHIPKGTFFAVIQDKPTPMRVLKKPNLSTQAVLQWAVEAATAAYTLNFNNYPEQIAAVRVYFTGPGYENFLTAFNNAKILSTIKEKKLILSAVPTGTPIILNEAEGEYGWQIQFPMLITYQSASSQLQQNIVLTLLIVEVPTSESARGIGISQFTMDEKSVGS